MGPSDVTVAIPTYERGEVLVSTVEQILGQAPGAEIVLLDQTVRHTDSVTVTLERLAGENRIRWLRLARPSIPVAMNEGLRQARRPIVLFLDDDIIAAPGLIASHAACYSAPEVWAVSGQVLQPGQVAASLPTTNRGKGLAADLDFHFNHDARTVVANCMAGNLSVRSERALDVGGFDENFVGVAYRFETDFCRRLRQAGGRILFEPTASVRHLKAPSGGIRVHGDHRTSASPAHGVGDYYFAFRHGSAAEGLTYILKRPFREVCTRFHLRHPWWIPAKLTGELRAFLWAVRLARAGPRLSTRG